MPPLTLRSHGCRNEDRDEEEGRSGRRGDGDERALGYTILVPKVDADGNDRPGIRIPQFQVPTATYTGWNTRAAGFRQGDLCGLNGMYLPFAKTRAERLATGDPRLSLAERYSSHSDYVSRIVSAAQRQRTERFLLQEDYDLIVEQAAASDVGK
jgi:hypothetical protein